MEARDEFPPPFIVPSPVSSLARLAFIQTLDFRHRQPVAHFLGLDQCNLYSVTKNEVAIRDLVP